MMFLLKIFPPSKHLSIPVLVKSTYYFNKPLSYIFVKGILMFESISKVLLNNYSTGWLILIPLS